MPLPDPVAAPSKPVRLRGRSFLALVLSPELPFSEWLASLDDLARRSTGFFLGRPIVLDLTGLSVTREAVAALVSGLSERGVRVMGIEGVLPSQLGPGMPPLMQNGREAGEVTVPDAPAGASPDAPNAPVSLQAPPALVMPAVPQTPSLIVETSVRSGQQIVFTEGDVTVLGSVSSGAEVIAGGSVHIYGSLRGRALAGSAGNPRARIFCQKLEAELIAIDGLYKTAEDLEPSLRGRPTQAWLDGERLCTVALF